MKNKSAHFFSIIFSVIMGLSMQFFPVGLAAQNLPPVLVLEAPIDSFVSVKPHCGVYIDASNSTDWEAMYRRLPNLPLMAVDSIPDFGKFDQGRFTYWLFFEIETTEGFPQSKLFFKTPTRGFIHLFQLENDSLTKMLQSGYELEKHQFAANRSAFDRYALPLELRPNKHYRFLVRLQSVPGFTHQFFMYLHRPGYDLGGMYSKVTVSYFILGGFFISFLLFAAFSFFQYLSNQDKAFLFYSLYVGAIVLYFLRAFNMSNPQWFVLPAFFNNYWYHLPFQFLVYFGYVFFLIYFLDAKKRFPNLYRYLKLFLWSLVVIFLIDRTLHAIDVFWAYEFVYWTRFFIHTCSIIFLVYIFQKRDPLARYAALGSFLLIASLLVTQVISFDKTWVTGFFDQADLPAVIGIMLELFCFSLGLGYKNRLAALEKIQAENELSLKAKEAEHLNEVAQVKSKVFDNLTHEFRTPLTVISGMADELKNNPNNDKDKKINLIKQNSQKLLSLVNRMLDLAKLKSGKLPSHIRQGDMVAFLKYQVEAHESAAKMNDVGLQFYTEEKELHMDFDAEKMEQVVSNLVSNAIKFTPRYGKILVVAKSFVLNKSPFLEIKIKDNGIGISERQLPFIFDRFHQADPAHENQGSGIGLALVKELVADMNGEIEVGSQVGAGTTFLLRFPVSNQAPLAEAGQKKVAAPPLPLSTGPQAVAADPDSDLPILLIIEDNPDVTFYLQTLLENDYQIVASRNGKNGVERALEILPDIIICDVMMTEMDGFEVCQTLKTDGRTDHIPIILLTAKATQEDKLAGLQHGADAYLVKPFEKQELFVRLEKLREVRKKLQLKYSGGLIGQKTGPDGLKSNEEIFIEKLESIVLQNMGDEDFSIHELSRELLLSRSQAHRKIKALTGLSTAVYIRQVRLQKAKELLSTTRLSISEIAYQVGFKTPVYFSQAFKEVFGESPSSVRK